jgi:anti-sigma regulatory factor (Ser/Thr protein kinase)
VTCEIGEREAVVVVVDGSGDGAGAGLLGRGGGAADGPRRAAFTGEPRTSTVAEARRWARGVLAAWDADGLEWELSQLLTEVVTNAVLHAGTPLRVVLEQDVSSGRLRCEVSDGSPARPRVRRHSTDATTGRGLQLLESVASAWGVEPLAAGKTVWFEVDGASDASIGGEDLAALLAELGEGTTAATSSDPSAVAGTQARGPLLGLPPHRGRLATAVAAAAAMAA